MSAACCKSSLPNAYGKDFKTILKKSGENGRPCVVPDLKGKSFGFAVECDINGFKHLKDSSFYSSIESFLL